MLASMPIVRVTNRKGPLSHTMHDIRGHKRRAALKTYQTSCKCRQRLR